MHTVEEVEHEADSEPENEHDMSVAVEVEDQKSAAADAEQGNDRDKWTAERPGEIRLLDPDEENSDRDNRKGHQRAHIDQFGNDLEGEKSGDACREYSGDEDNFYRVRVFVWTSEKNAGNRPSRDMAKKIRLCPNNMTRITEVMPHSAPTETTAAPHDMPIRPRA